tara:strand:- start:1424 stop:1621 length:198 start_codon:yes stop_codon:yes gene_type:complete
VVFHLREKNLKHIGAWLSALAVVILLSACGQKGALYLPEEPNDSDYVTTARESSPKALILNARSK